MATFLVPGAKFHVLATTFPQIRAFWDVDAVCLGGLPGVWKGCSLRRFAETAKLYSVREET